MNAHDGGIPDSDFRRLTAVLQKDCGIAVSPAKRVMVETRLRKRARHLGMGSLGEYCAFVLSPGGKQQEWANLVDAVTTHKTDFFREPAHFDYMVNRILPELAARGVGRSRPLLIWSAACSTGEEPYTLAMVLSDYAESAGAPEFMFRIEASDISIPAIETARAAVYRESAVEPVPAALRRKYVLRSKDRDHRVVRIAPEIRSLVRFRQINLTSDDFGFREPLDIVMCRNVLIYFERPVQAQILQRIGLTLRLGGYLVMGHSESLNGLDVPFEAVAPTVYRRIG
jgi:chemotaxis protein methyltransferase CheR